MKKLYLTLFILLMFVLPLNISAISGNVDKYYVDATVLDNGDVLVKELIVYSGTYNGFERIVVYGGSAPIFDGSDSSFENSDIYMGDDIELIAIKSIPVSSDSSFNYINNAGELFTKVYTAYEGDKLLYTESLGFGSATYRMYNSTVSSVTGFYLEYIIKDKAVLHNDVAELGLSIFGDDFNESIDYFEMLVHIPNNVNAPLTWVHGEIGAGEVSIVDNNTVKTVATYLSANKLLDTRVVFDKDVIKNSTKKTNVEALDSIKRVEDKWADIADNLIKQAKMYRNVYYVLISIWFVGLIYIINYMYNKYDKEHNSTFKTKYFRDFPATYGPEIVGYLVGKSVSSKDMSASLTNLIAKKVVTFEEIDKKNFSLIYTDKTIVVSKAEEFLLNWFFNELGTDSKVTVADINTASKKHYDKFLTNYNKWTALVKQEGISYNFFEKAAGAKTKASLYALLGILISVLTMQVINLPLVQGLAIIVSIISFIYFVSITKRTQEGNHQYSLWMGLKNFLKDFGKFEARDLPNIVLWEKYLVYALVFGLAGKLAKTMSIRFTELNGNNMNNMGNFNSFNRMILINNMVSSNVNNAVSSATNARAAAASSASRGGGGGFSGGGGGFGGGGGGGF